MQILDFVLLHVVFVSGLMNAFVNGLENQDILCTSVSSWLDAMDTCLYKGGRPLTHDDIKMTNLSGKVNLTVWTAEYTVISNQIWNSSTDHYPLKDTVCGIQTINLTKKDWGSVIDKITDIKYKNCTEQQAYVCDRGQDPSIKNHMHPHVYLNKTTWINAETSCKSQNQRLFTVNQLDSGNYIPVDSSLSESMKLDVWIGLLASLDIRMKTEKGPLKSDNIIKYGTFSNSVGYRMIDGYLRDQFTALCGFESLMSVNKAHFTDCLDDIPWLQLAVIISCSALVAITSGSVAICLYKKRRREEIRMVDGPMANNGSGDYDYARGEELNVAAVESRNSLASEPGVLGRNKDRSQEGQVELHIYDSAN